jgi:hypothetical protein
VNKHDQKSIFFVSLPKSGTVYTWNSLCDMTGIKMPQFHLMEGWDAYNAGRDFSCPDLYACGDYNTQLLRPEQMKHYLTGHIFGAHMQASHHNMTVLEESGIDRITVLLRDPRDAFVSWVHHLKNLGLPARNYHSRIYHIPRDYYEWPLDKQFDFQVRSFLPTTINWIEGWLDYYASSERKVEVLFVFYDELKRDAEAYVRKIVEFHEVDDVDYSKLVVPEQGKMHFRKGEHEEWKVDFSLENQRLAEDLLQDRIVRGFEAAARSHQSNKTVERAVAARDYRGAAEAALEGITQFSSCKHGFQMLLRIAEAAAVDASSLRRAVDDELGSPSTGSYFRYREGLVHQARNIADEISRVGVTP